VSKIREKAFFAVMAQSGLRPHTIRQLRLKNFEPLDKLPCKIEVPKEMTKGKFGSYVTIVGPDAIKHQAIFGDNNKSDAGQPRFLLT
jgi:hypothetical protein